MPGDRIDDPLRALAQLDEQIDHLSGHLGRVRLANQGIASDHLDARWNELSAIALLRLRTYTCAEF